MSKTKVKPIRPLEGYGGMNDEQVVTEATAVLNGTFGNPHFTTPPVDQATFKANIDSLTTLIAEAKDGSKKIIAQKNKQRRAVIKNLRALGRYVEVTSDDDMAVFTSSGFKPAPNTKSPPQPLAQPGIHKIKHGPVTGQLLIKIKTVPKAISYDLRYAPVTAAATPPNWTTQAGVSPKGPVPVDGLTPGTIYAFQVRAQGRAGFTNWSDSSTCMCT